MFIVNTAITFTGTVSKSKYDGTKTNYYYMLTKPDNTMGTYASLTISGFSATSDGTFSYSITPTTSGLYKISHYSDSESTFGSGILLGEHLFNVVTEDTTSSFRI